MELATERPIFNALQILVISMERSPARAGRNLFYYL